DAMPTGGKLTFETRNVILDEEDAHTHADARLGPHVLLAGGDTGTGVGGGTRGRGLRPLFTTQRGKGTGAGLAAGGASGKQAGGHVAVHSEPGVGTRFEVFFPPAEGQATHEKPAPPAPVRGGTEALLLVEDDERIRTLTEQALLGRGYKVLCA